MLVPQCQGTPQGSSDHAILPTKNFVSPLSCHIFKTPNIEFQPSPLQAPHSPGLLVSPPTFTHASTFWNTPWLALYKCLFLSLLSSPVTESAFALFGTSLKFLMHPTTVILFRITPLVIRIKITYPRRCFLVTKPFHRHKPIYLNKNYLFIFVFPMMPSTVFHTWDRAVKYCNLRVV